MKLSDIEKMTIPRGKSIWAPGAPEFPPKGCSKEELADFNKRYREYSASLDADVKARPDDIFWTTRPEERAEANRLMDSGISLYFVQNYSGYWKPGKEPAYIKQHPEYRTPNLPLPS